VKGRIRVPEYTTPPPPPSSDFKTDVTHWTVGLTYQTASLISEFWPNILWIFVFLTRVYFTEEHNRDTIFELREATLVN